MMKKFTLLLMTLVLATMQAWAAPVDPSAASTMAQNFWSNSTGIFPNVVPTSGGVPELLYAQVSSVNPTQNAYYIYNTSNGFIIVAGDDRAEQILAYGDEEFDMDDIPIAMQYMLDSYKEEIDFLLANPDLEVEPVTMLRASTVSPLLTANWAQGSPYYNKTPKSNGSYCKTGCSCVSLCQVMYFWKHPTAAVPSVPAYTTSTLGLSVSALSSTTFDWSNMLKSYSGSYNSTQANAVATLMRYVGQAEKMDYTPSGSGAAVIYILEAAKLFGYNHNAERIYRSDFTDAQWASKIQTELSAGRPIVMAGWNSEGSLGHAFNVDGYNASTNKYHLNWGWGGSCNGYFSLNAFNPSNYNFSSYQQMLIGLKPQTPEIEVSPTSLSFTAITGQTKTATFTVTGYALTGDLTVKLSNANGIYKIDKTSISKSAATSGATVTVTYTPTDGGTSTASVTISGGGATAKTVSLSGTATKPVITVNPSSLSFSAVTGETKTATFTVTGTNLTGNLTLTLNNANGIYSINKTSITKSAATSGATVTVTYSPTEAGTSNASVTVSGGGADPKTVSLSGTAVKPEITVSPATLIISTITGQPKTATFTVTGTNLTGNLSLTLNNGGSVYAIDKTTITKSAATNTATVTVTYSPTVAGTNTATVTVSGGGADPKTVRLNGTAVTPVINVDPTSLSFSGVTGDTITKTFTVTGTDLTGKLTLKLNNGGGIYKIDKTSITKAAATIGATVTVSYCPSVAGTSNASVTISGGDAESVTVSLSGTAVTPVITVNPTSLSFNGVTGVPVTKTFTVTGIDLTGSLRVKLNDSSNSYSIDKTSITKSAATSGATVTVTYCSSVAGTSNASVTISGGGAEAKTVSLSGTAVKPEITVDPTSLSFSAITGETKTATFTVTGTNLTSDLSVSIRSTRSPFMLDKTTISMSEATDVATVTVTYHPTEGGSSSAVIDITGGGADAKTVSLSGNAITPVITVEPDSLSYNTYVNQTVKQTIKVKGYNASFNDVTFTFSDTTGCYRIGSSNTSISGSNFSSNVEVVYKPTVAGTNNATLTIGCGAAEVQTVYLSGVANAFPEIEVDANSLSFDQTYSGYASSRTITITCPDLPSNLELALTNDYYHSYGLSKFTITPEEAAAGVRVTVYFQPSRGGYLRGNLSIRYNGCEALSIPLSGTAIQSDGYITGGPTNLSFETEVGTPVTETFTLHYSLPNGAIMVSSVGGETGQGAEGNGEGSMPTFNASILGPGESASMNKIIIDSIDWNIDPIDPIDPISLKRLSLEVIGDNCFSVSQNLINVWNDSYSGTVTVTYLPDSEGVHEATIKITCTSGSVKPLIVSLHGTATAPEPTMIRGDVNGDGVLSIRDVTQLIDLLLSDMPLPACADVDENGSTNIRDVTALIDLLLAN